MFENIQIVLSDWTHRGYPPDKQEQATPTVLAQAQLLCKDWSHSSARERTPSRLTTGTPGDTLRCSLLLLERRPVCSGSCGFLRLLFGFPLSPLDPLLGCVTAFGPWAPTGRSG